jgi:hypothetical protein
MPPAIIDLYFRAPWQVGNLGLPLIQLCRRHTALSPSPDYCIGITISEAYALTHYGTPTPWKFGVEMGKRPMMW